MQRSQRDVSLLSMVTIESAGITDIGKKRKNNEDALSLDDDLGLYIVADGMGGHLAGEVASGLVVETIRDYMIRFKEDEDVDELEDADMNLSKEANRLLSGITLANQGIYQVSKSNNAYRGMGSTVSVIYFTDETVISANVGDSPVYLVKKGSIELLSVTHNALSELMVKNPEAAKWSEEKYKHMLTRAMGIEETVKPDICEIECFDGDILTISSDGLSDKVTPNEILDVVISERPEKACQTLVDLANRRGGDDNITVIVLKVKADKRERGGKLGIVSQVIRALKKLFT